MRVMNCIFRDASQQKRLNVAQTPTAHYDQVTALFLRRTADLGSWMAFFLAGLIRHVHFFRDAARWSECGLFQLPEILLVHGGADNFSERPVGLDGLKDIDNSQTRSEFTCKGRGDRRGSEGTLRAIRSQ